MEQQLREQTDAQEREVTIIGGKAFYVDDGTFAYLTERPAFKVEDEGSATWLMEKLSEMDGELAGLAERRSALVSNIDSMIADVTRSREGMEYRYGPELIEFASRNLPESKSGRVIKKTWTCPFGKVSFKDKAPRLVVVDRALAVKLCEGLELADAIKRPDPAVLVSMLPADMEARIHDEATDPADVGFRIEPAVLDIPKIKTGV